MFKAVAALNVICSLPLAAAVQVPVQRYRPSVQEHEFDQAGMEDAIAAQTEVMLRKEQIDEFSLLYKEVADLIQLEDPEALRQGAQSLQNKVGTKIAQFAAKQQEASNKLQKIQSKYQATFSLFGEGSCSPDEKDTHRIGDWVYDSSKSDAQKACQEQPACQGFHWNLQDKSYVLVSLVGPELGPDSDKGELCYKKPQADILDSAAAPATGTATVPFRDRKRKMKATAPRDHELMAARAPFRDNELKAAMVAGIAEQVQRDLNDAKAQEAAKTRDESKAARADWKANHKKAGFTFFGEGACSQNEEDHRIGGWVYGSNKVGAQSACKERPACKGFHWNVDKNAYVLVNKVGPELGPHSEEGELCYRKPVA